MNDDGEENEVIIVPSIWSVIKDLFTDYSVVESRREKDLRKSLRILKRDESKMMKALENSPQHVEVNEIQSVILQLSKTRDAIKKVEECLTSMYDKKLV